MVHVAQLRTDGTLDIPSTGPLLLEVGANTRNTLDRELLPCVPDAFLLTFEPLLDKYAARLAHRRMRHDWPLITPGTSPNAP